MQQAMILAYMGCLHRRRRDVVDPTQQELPPVLAEVLADSVTAWGEGRAVEARDLPGAAHELADSLGYG